MSYTLDSSFLAPAVGVAAQWADALRSRNSADADTLAQTYFAFTAQAALNADLALAQMCHETAWATSAHYIARKNMAGLGVTSPDTPGPDFGTLARGVQAHLAHLCCYVYPADPPAVLPWAALDPRHTFHDARPRVRDLVRSDRRWADPGDGYAASIVAIANQVTGGTIMPDSPTTDDLGFPVRVHLAADVGPRRAPADLVWFIVHDTEGYPAGDESVLTDAAPPVESAHALILPGGALVFMAPLEETAWTPGNDAVAVRSVNVELSGFATRGYTDAQYVCLARFFRWCMSRGMTVPATYAGRSGDPGIIGHCDVPNPAVPGAWGGIAGHTDPGPRFDWDKLTSLITEASLPQSSIPGPQSFFVPGNPYGAIPLLPPFWNRWHLLDTSGLALPMMGYPLSAETTLPNGRRLQHFERGYFATQDAPDPWNLVALPAPEWPQNPPG